MWKWVSDGKFSIRLWVNLIEMLPSALRENSVNNFWKKKFSIELFSHFIFLTEKFTQLGKYLKTQGKLLALNLWKASQKVSIGNKLFINFV